MIFYRIYCNNSSQNDVIVFIRAFEKFIGQQNKFISFELLNSHNTELNDNTLGELSFVVIFLMNNTELAKIERNAFNAAKSKITMLSIIDCPKLSNSKESRIFEIKSDFVNLEFLELVNTNITSIKAE